MTAIRKLHLQQIEVENEALMYFSDNTNEGDPVYTGVDAKMRSVWLGVHWTVTALVHNTEEQ